MSFDDPFASGDERTYLMPSPGQRGPRENRVRQSIDARDSAAPQAISDLIPERGLNRIVAAASPLLNAMPQLRSSVSQGEPATLREALAAGVRAFEAQVIRDGVSASHALAARYILCTALDETASSTPWGGSGVWGRHSLLVLFHNEAWGGEKVFQLLGRLAEQPSENRELLELMYVVLALGFEGRYRVIEGGRNQLEQVRERLLAMIRAQRGPYEPALSPHWQGVAAQRRRLFELPAWIAFAVAGLLALALYTGLAIHLNQFSDPVFAAIHGIETKPPVPAAAPIAAPAPPRPPASPPEPRLAALLAPDIAAGRIAIADQDDRSIITIRGDGLFTPGGASIAPDVRPLIERIAAALATVPGRVVVTGHTDSQPIRTARFPSNYHLSAQRADAVRDLLASQMPLNRIESKGMSDSKPVAGNSTASDRARNRRVEITLHPAKPLA